MILQFIGFFVVFGCGALAIIWAGHRLYYDFKTFSPEDDTIGFEIVLLLVTICLGCGMMYCAGTQAPFEISLSASLRN